MTATQSLAQALSAQDIIRHYDLMPHVEGGHYRRVWCSSQDLQPESLPCGIYGSRPIAYYQGSNALYDLWVSDDPVDRELFHEFCRFVVGNPLRSK